jgi:hypothetical protein
MTTCKPTLFLLTVKEILLYFYNYKFSVAHKMLCTPWLRNPLTISRLSCLGRKRPRRQFFSRFVKVRFRSKVIINDCPIAVGVGDVVQT